MDVRLVERVTKPNPGMPVLEVLLVLSGTRTLAVDVGHTFDDSLDEQTPVGTLFLIAEEDAPKPWSAGDDESIEVRLPSRGPILYRFSSQSPDLLDTFAIVRDRDTLVAFSYFLEGGEAADQWTKTATVRLARGATLRFP